MDAVRAILDVWNNHEDDDEANIVNATDPSSQSTSLHKASANGHASTVQLLLARGAEHLPNDHGNTPLHWAAGAGHAKVVKLLLDHFDVLFLEREEMERREKLKCRDGDHGDGDGDGDVVAKGNGRVERLDVLLKNNFGRSALTEGFASGDTPTVDVLLNHDSAEEERLIGGLERKDVDEEEGEDVAAGRGEGGENADGKGDAGEGKTKEEKKNIKSILHEFDFLRGSRSDPSASDCEERPSVFIRELVRFFHFHYVADCVILLETFSQSNHYDSPLHTPMIPSVNLPSRTPPASVFGALPSSWHDGWHRQK